MSTLWRSGVHPPYGGSGVRALSIAGGPGGLVHPVEALGLVHPVEALGGLGFPSISWRLWGLSTLWRLWEPGLVPPAEALGLVHLCPPRGSQLWAGASVSRQSPGWEGWPALQERLLGEMPVPEAVLTGGAVGGSVRPDRRVPLLGPCPSGRALVARSWMSDPALILVAEHGGRGRSLILAVVGPETPGEPRGEPKECPVRLTTRPAGGAAVLEMPCAPWEDWVPPAARTPLQAAHAQRREGVMSQLTLRSASGPEPGAFPETHAEPQTGPAEGEEPLPMGHRRSGL